MTDTAETFHFRPGGRIEQGRGGVGFAPGEAERLRERCFPAGPGPKYAKQSQFVDSGDAPRRHGDRREGYNYITGKSLYATLCVLCDSVVNRVRPAIGDSGLRIGDSWERGRAVLRIEMPNKANRPTAAMHHRGTEGTEVNITIFKERVYMQHSVYSVSPW